MKSLFFLIVVATTLFACTKSSMAPLDQQKGRKDKTVSTLSLGPNVQIVESGSDSVSITDITFGQAEGAYVNYSGYNIHATVDPNVSVYVAYVQLWDGANWNSTLFNDNGATGSVYGFDGRALDGTYTAKYRVLVINQAGNFYYSPVYQIN